MAKRAKISICRFRTDRFREMTLKQIEAARWRFKRDDSGQRFFHQISERGDRGLMTSFVNAIRHLVYEEDRIRRGVFGRGSSDVRLKVMEAARKTAHAEVTRLEQKIWDRQAKRRCKIDPAELVARDAVRQGGIDQTTIDQLRGKRRPKIR